MDYKILIQKAKEFDLEDIEISSRHNSTAAITIYNGEIDKNEVCSVKSCTIKGMYKGKLGYYYCENLNESETDVLKKLQQNASSINTDEEFFIYKGDAEYPKVRNADDDFLHVKGTEKIDLLKKIEEKLKSFDPRVVFIPYLGYEETIIKAELVNSKGLNLSKEYSTATIFTQVVVKENDKTQSAFEVQTKRSYSELNADELVAKVLEKALSMLNAKPIPSDKLPVIIENKAMTSLLGAFLSMFSGEAAIKKLTLLLGKEQQKIMSEKITIVDDPLCADALINYPFDDEGVACFKKVIVKEGVFQTFLHNLKTANHFKTKSTGNGFGTIISCANLYIEKGKRTKEEIITEMDKGLLITSFAGLHSGVDAVSGDFSIQSSGFYIENGKIVKPVTLIVTSGNFLKAMSEVEEVASDLEKDFQRIASPSIKFKELQISGE